MSYCVHCGVELADSEKICPLCYTPVIDPNRIERTTVPVFANDVHIPRQGNINHRFVAVLVGFIMLIPLAVVTVTNILTAHNLTWSLYVFGAELFVWTAFVFPFCIPKTKPYIYVALDMLVAGLYLYLIYFLTKGDGWFLKLAMPLTLQSAVFSLMGIHVIRRKKLVKLEKTGYMTIFVALYFVGIDMFLRLYLTGEMFAGWSWYVAIPVFVLGIVFIFIAKNVRIGEWIKKRMFL